MTDRVGPTPYIDQELANERENNPARWSDKRLGEETIRAFADWVQEPDDELEGQCRAIRAMAVAGETGQVDALLAEVIKPRKRVCRRCEGEGLIGDGYVCASCDGSGFDR